MRALFRERALGAVLVGSGRFQQSTVAVWGVVADATHDQCGEALTGRAKRVDQRAILSRVTAGGAMTSGHLVENDPPALNDGVPRLGQHLTVTRACRDH